MRFPHIVTDVSDDCEASLCISQVWHDIDCHCWNASRPNPNITFVLQRGQNIFVLCGIFFWTDIDECNSQFGGRVCDLNARCHNVIGSFRCVCNEGFQQEGKLCRGEWVGHI